MRDAFSINPITLSGQELKGQVTITQKFNLQDIAAKNALVATGGGNLIATGGGNILSPKSANLVASGGGNLVATGGGNFISHNGSARAQSDLVVNNSASPGRKYGDQDSRIKSRIRAG